jgi:hypothetical protein
VKVVPSTALTRRASLFPGFAVARRAVVGGALAFISVTTPLSARSGELQPIDSSRIVSIGGAVTETIYALGLEGFTQFAPPSEPIDQKVRSRSCRSSLT